MRNPVRLNLGAAEAPGEDVSPVHDIFIHVRKRKPETLISEIATAKQDNSVGKTQYEHQSCTVEIPQCSLRRVHKITSENSSAKTTMLWTFGELKTSNFMVTSWDEKEMIQLF